MDLEGRNSRAKGRQLAFFEALPKDLRDQEDAIPAVIRSMNASPRSKLQRIYRLADAMMEVRKPFVACKRGCADCCRMNVTISTEEATRIAAASGRVAKKLFRSVRHDIDTFAGVPCPFLDGDGVCSIYLDRPLACRNHASFDEDAKLCTPTLMNNAEMPMVNYDGLGEALGALAAMGKGSVFADIRDFFPQGDD